MATTQLQELRASALDYADMTSSTFPVTGRLDEYINTALGELQDELISSGGDYFLATTTVTLVAGTEAYALPVDFQRLKKAWYNTNGRRYKVRRWNYEESDAWTIGPVSAGTVDVWYNPFITALSGDTDTVEQVLPIGWDDYVALSAAVKLLLREESDHSGLKQLRDEKLAHIIRHATPRDDSEPESIADFGQRFSQAHIVLPDYRDLRYRIEGSNIRFLELEYTR